ncbi:HlyD family efflux transporter periplasmic adaptor subunit [Corallococcus aberystwythensis]|uniref:HlyD family efflux transporter periplasmic adaptor subunit n=1 Tax=Corallococcus aberystwythensis TaxID=2316722 RepID=A0A3A8QRH0_9BACT|nr:HlyD family efflux transporter periplasmic adaptor subunit [Corallococcus aberystwythensis]RKH71147.1 HlyD family efflux transporter periplasmic adaptor subunit [Corallococcus aberystwythensis]
MAEDDRARLFRTEALEHYTQGWERGGLLRLAPAWTTPVFWVLLGACVFALLFSAVVHVSEYAEGPAVIRLEGRVDLPSPVRGTVASVEVRSGQRVAAGQVLARLGAPQELAELERYEREFELLLRRRLRDPSDEGARQSLSSLRAQLELARVRLDQWTVRAPEAGIVNDVRIHRGQHLAEGEVVASLVSADAATLVTALLPGEYRPLLVPGGPLRLELRGFPHQYQELTIDEVGGEVVGPHEVQRALGPTLSSSVEVSGAVVMVRARLASRAFEADGANIQYFDGMLGQADARVRSRPILLLLVPGLRALWP